jgi:hypothetical protein
MTVFIQNQITKKFYAGNGKWINGREQASVFASAEAAITECTRQNLEDAQVVLSFHHPDEDLTLPCNHRPFKKCHGTLVKKSSGKKLESVRWPKASLSWELNPAPSGEWTHGEKNRMQSRRGKLSCAWKEFREPKVVVEIAGDACHSLKRINNKLAIHRSADTASTRSISSGRTAAATNLHQSQVPIPFLFAPLAVH